MWTITTVYGGNSDAWEVYKARSESEDVSVFVHLLRVDPVLSRVDVPEPTTVEVVRCVIYNLFVRVQWVFTSTNWVFHSD